MRVRLAPSRSREAGNSVMVNGARGTRDIEGKVTRVGASECGQRTSFKPSGEGKQEVTHHRQGRNTSRGNGEDDRRSGVKERMKDEVPEIQKSIKVTSVLSIDDHAARREGRRGRIAFRQRRRRRFDMENDL